MKQTVRIKFLDSNSKEVVRKRLEDACKKIADDYQTHPELNTPVLQVGQFPNGEWDTKICEGMTRVKNTNLLNYVDEEGKLDFETLLKEFYEFLNERTTKKLETENHEIVDEVDLQDEEEETEEEEESDTADETEEEEDPEEESEEESEEEQKTYKEYFTEELKSLDKTDFRYYLITLILGEKEAKNWSYIKDLKELKGNEFDVVTPKNAKKVVKTISKA